MAEPTLIPSQDISARFDKLEGKIDILSDAMVNLARNEEKIVALQQNVVQQAERLNKLSVKIDDVEKVSLNNSIASKIVFAALTAIVISIVNMYM